MDDSARFCPACGATMGPAVTQRAWYPGQLTRPRYPRMIAGVCSGLALHYGWDLTLTRFICAMLIIFTGVGLIAYLVAWIVIPEAPFVLPETTTSTGPPV